MARMELGSGEARLRALRGAREPFASRAGSRSVGAVLHALALLVLVLVLVGCARDGEAPGWPTSSTRGGESGTGIVGSSNASGSGSETRRSEGSSAEGSGTPGDTTSLVSNLPTSGRSTTSFCGDGVVDRERGEVCDEGPEGNDEQVGTCASDCRSRLCTLGPAGSHEDIAAALADDTCFGLRLERDTFELDALLRVERDFQFRGSGAGSEGTRLVQSERSSERVFRIAEGARVRMSDLAIRGRETPHEGIPYAGLDVYGELILSGVAVERFRTRSFGGAIRVREGGVVRVIDGSALRDNEAGLGDGDDLGSASVADVLAGGLLEVRESDIANNTTWLPELAEGSAIKHLRGAVLVREGASLEARGARFLGNRFLRARPVGVAGYSLSGAAIHCSGGTLMLRDTLLEGNGTSTEEGARILEPGEDAVAVLVAEGGALFAQDCETTLEDVRMIGGRVEIVSDETAAGDGLILATGGCAHFSGGALRAEGLELSSCVAATRGPESSTTLGGGMALLHMAEVHLQGFHVHGNEVSAGSPAGDGRVSIASGGGIWVEPGSRALEAPAHYVFREGSVQGNAVFQSWTNEGAASILDGGGFGFLTEGDLAHRFELTNVTFEGNSVRSEGVAGGQVTGGALFIYADNSAPTLRISHATIVDNEVVADSASPLLRGGGVRAEGEARVTLRNTILEGNVERIGTLLTTEGHCSASQADRITLLGAVLIHPAQECGDGSGAEVIDTQSAGLLDPVAAAGYSRVLPIAPTSLARDAVPAAACLDASGETLEIDQRGQPRVDPCDIGAYEVR